MTDKTPKPVLASEANAMRNLITDLLDCRTALFEILAHARRAQVNPQYAKDNCVCIEKLTFDCLARTGTIFSPNHETKEKTHD